MTNNVEDTIGNALRADCVAYWTMNEANGTRVDATGRGNDAVQTNAPEAVTGMVGDAIHFDKDSNQILTIADSSDTKMANGNWYISCWVKVLSQADIETRYGYTVLGKMDVDTGIVEYEIYYKLSGEPLTNKWFSLYIDPANNDSIGPFTEEIQIGEWYFVDAYYDVATQTGGIAVNNGAFVTQQMNDTAVTNGVPMIFGKHPNSDFWNADLYVDEVAFFKPAAVPISSDQRNYLYNSGAGRTLYP